MGKIAFVFPGQGAQAVGMGKDAYEAFDSSRSVIDRADEALGFNLSEIIFNGPEEVLKQTANTQPALLTVSIALLEAFKDRGIKPDFAAGHSLGEYSALVAAGVLSFEDAVRTVRARGQFMEQAVPSGQGAMAAVLERSVKRLLLFVRQYRQNSEPLSLLMLTARVRSSFQVRQQGCRV